MSATGGKRRALVLIDVQNDYDGGGLAITYPPFAESIAAIGRAMDAARAHGLRIIAVRQSAPPRSPIFAVDSHGRELHAAVVGRGYDHLVDKALPSAFAGTDLEAYLRENGIETLTVAGYMTHNCVMSTIVDAVHRGFAVEFLSDAAGSLAYANAAGVAGAEDLHRVMSVVFQSRFAAVCRTGEWITHLANGTEPERDSVRASHQRALAGASA